MTTVRFRRLHLLVKNIGPALARMGEVEWYKVKRRHGVIVEVIAHFDSDERILNSPYALGKRAEVSDAKPPRPRRARKRTHDRRHDEYVADDGEPAYSECVTRRDFAREWERERYLGY
jgi:hypothetical protein